MINQEYSAPFLALVTESDWLPLTTTETISSIISHRGEQVGNHHAAGYFLSRPYTQLKMITDAPELAESKCDAAVLGSWKDHESHHV